MAKNFTALLKSNAALSSEVRDLQKDNIRSKLDLYVLRLSRSNTGNFILDEQDKQLAVILSGWLNIIETENDDVSTAALYKQLSNTKNESGQRCLIRHVAADFAFPVAFIDHIHTPFFLRSPMQIFSPFSSAQIVLARSTTISNFMSNTIEYYGGIEPRTATNDCTIRTSMFRFGHGEPSSYSARNGRLTPKMVTDFWSDGSVYARDGYVRILSTFYLEPLQDYGEGVASSSSSSYAQQLKKRKTY